MLATVCGRRAAIVSICSHIMADKWRASRSRVTHWAHNDVDSTSKQRRVPGGIVRIPRLGYCMIAYTGPRIGGT